MTVVGAMNETITGAIDLKTSQKSIGPGVESYVGDMD